MVAWFWLTAKNDRLAYLAADGIAQGILQEGLAEDLVRVFGKEPLFERALFEGLLLIFTRVVGEGHDEPVFGEQLGGYFRSGVNHGGVDQIAIPYAVE